MPLIAADYRPRDTEHAVPYRVIVEHLEAFLETASVTAPSGHARCLSMAWQFPDVIASATRRSHADGCISGLPVQRT